MKKYMQASGKSRKDICQALGISYFTVSDWVNGKKYPRMDKIELLANYFGIQKSDLIELKAPASTKGDGIIVENFGERMKSIREAKKLTQEKLARNIGVSASTIGMYEQNRREPDLETLKKIAKILNTSLDYLLNLEIFLDKKEKTQAGIRLSGSETELIKLFRSVPEDLQRRTLDVLHSLYGK